VNPFDVLLLVCAAVLVVVGMVKGLVRVLIGIVALAAAFVLAARYHEGLAARIAVSQLPATVLRAGSYALIVLGVMLLGALVAAVVRRLVQAAMLGWADRLGGAALGLVAATLLAALVVLPLVAYFPSGAGLLEGSVLAPYVTVVSDLANLVAPEDLATRYRRGVEQLRRHWRGERGLEVNASPAPGVLAS
jgi:membrane protein required for colicin V production